MTINQGAPGCGLGRPGKAQQLRFQEGGIDNFCWGGGVGNSGHFGPVRTISYVPLVTSPQGHYNQPATALVWAETAGGLRGGYV
jgi:hypothetical protein